MGRKGSNRRATLAVVALGALALGVLPPTASAAELPPVESPGPQIVERCHETAGQVPEIGPRACRNAEQFFRVLAQLCRFTGGPEDTCGLFDGRRLGEAAMAEFEASWTHRALTLQRALDDTEPLQTALVPGTHNSFHSATYAPTLSGLDHNQVVSMTDQLRLGMRSLELDVHWAPSAEGQPEHAFMAPILCHGQPIDEGPLGSSPVIVHFGCTVERHLRHGLEEIRAWLETPGNEDEVLVLYLENNLDDDPTAHDAAADTIQEVLGEGDGRANLVFQPPEASPCASMPITSSRADLLDAGAQVLLVGNCDTDIDGVSGGWGAWVHERDRPASWIENKSGPGDDFDCTADRGAKPYGTTFIRFFEDATWLSAMVDGSGLGGPGEITVNETRDMVNCGVNLFGFDLIGPDDPRLGALVWSWAVDEPGDGDRASHGADGRFAAAAETDERPYACRTSAGDWLVTGNGVWSDGASACAAHEATFSVPRTAWDNQQLVDAKADADVSAVWLDYGLHEGIWTPDLSDLLGEGSGDDSNDDALDGLDRAQLTPAGDRLPGHAGGTRLSSLRAG